MAPLADVMEAVGVHAHHRTALLREHGPQFAHKRRLACTAYPVDPDPKGVTRLTRE
jgi:hypothetical protein